MKTCVFFIALLLPLLGHGQIGFPVSAQTDLYFPHFADGGPASGQWQTRFTFVNPNSASVTVTLFLHSDSGGDLSIDFGSGPANKVVFTIPPNGTAVLQSQIGPATVTGWAGALASSSIQANVAFRFIQNGVARVEITAEPTLPSVNYRSVATPQVGVALANIYSGALGVNVAVYDASGNNIGQASLSVPAGGHTSFNLSDAIAALPAGFTGSLLITPQVPGQYFLAWAVYSDSSGVISSLPSGRTGLPAPHSDDIQNVFFRLVNALQSYAPIFGGTPQLLISSENDDNAINAHAVGGSTVTINLALAELISDSPSELAFVVGHELGHIYQQRTYVLAWYPLDIEWDADAWGLLLSLLAGYDPYAGAGTLGKLAMATGTANLGIQEWEDGELAQDPHGAFSTRIANLTTDIQAICMASTSVLATCTDYHSLIHPHFPYLPTTVLQYPGASK